MKKDLQVRIISAIIACLIAIPLIIIGGYPFYFGVGLLAILGYKELLDLRKSHKKLPNLMIMMGVVCLILLLLGNLHNISTYFGIPYGNIIICLIFLLLPTVYFQDKYSTKDAFYLLGITIFLGLVFNLFIIARNRSLGLFLYLLLIPILTDTFAYICGRLFGKNKLCPTISPKKTWEGSFAGLIAGTLGGIIIYVLLVDHFSFKMVLVTALLSTIGQVGDLFMSKIKRENEIKDFSNIMPGHGGILDRIDSFIFVVLTYFLLMIYL